MNRLAATMIVLACAGFASGQTYVTPEEASKDPSFAIQGEYRGEIAMGDRKITVGLQVIGLGNDEYRVVVWKNGLPGDEGAQRDKDESTAKAVDGVVTFANPKQKDEGIVIKDGKAILMSDGNAVGTLPRIERKSPTLGKKAPEGAKVLFDGTEASLANWTGKGAKLSPQNHLQQGIVSKDTFGDHTVHIEFRTPYKPKARGQGRGNSGIYVQGRYEVQMLDSFGLQGKQNECGGIYSVGAPLVNMCYPPLSWQTYDIDFTAAKYDDAGKKTSHARLTVYHNGVKIHDDIVADHSTTASKLKEGPQPGPIYLQDHGNPVRYRNIWVLPKN